MTTEPEIEPLTTYICQEKWKEALERITTHPNEVNTLDETGGYLPIHRACFHDTLPLSLVEALIEANPQSVQVQDLKCGRIPLHNAVFCVSSTNKPIVQALLQKYPEGTAVVDKRGYTPLHVHLRWASKPSLEIVKMLVHVHPEAVRLVSNDDWTPLHLAAYFASWDISQYLIECYPDALLLKNEQKMTPCELTEWNHRYPKCAGRFRAEEETRFGKDSAPGVTPHKDRHTM